MMAREPRVRVHVERIVFDGVPPMRRGELAASIEAALVERLAGTAHAQPVRRPQPLGAQVGQAVAPTVLEAAGLQGDDTAGGPR